jgi:hypothetical protein
MALTPKFSVMCVNAKADAQATLADAGTLDIYDGTQPVTADTPVTTQVLLASIPLATPAFAAAVSGTASLNPVAAVVAAAGGIPSWFRLRASSAATICDGSAGTVGTNLIVSASPLVVGASVSALSFTMTESRG